MLKKTFNNRIKMFKKQKQETALKRRLRQMKNKSITGKFYSLFKKIILIFVIIGFFSTGILMF